MKKFGVMEPPVVMDKTTQRRELESIHLPGDETGYYKAYDGEKMVLVPKENLEAMKGLVNYTMRRRPDSMTARVPDHAKEEKEKKRFETKLEHLKANIDTYEKTQIEPLMALMEENKPSIKVEEIEHPFKKSEIASSLRRTEPSIKSLETLSLPSKDESDETPSLGLYSLSEEISLPYGDYVPDTKSVKFLISGHFRNNKKPIFIIRQYRGSSVIGKNFSDFNSVKNDKSVDISITGKFYKDSILRENNNKPKNIKFKSRKKIVVDSQSHILEDGFIELYTITEFDVVVGGMFVKNRKPSLPYYTPLVSIAIKRLKHSNSQIGFFADETVLSASTPVVQNPFVQELRQTHSDSKRRSRRKMTISSLAKQPYGFKSLLTRIDEEEEAFEFPPRPRPRRGRLSESSTSTQNSIIHKVKKRRSNNFTLSKISSMDIFRIFKKRKESTDEDKGMKSLGTKSTDVAPLRQILPPSSVKAEDISLPSTSNGTPLKTTEDNQIVPVDAPKPEVNGKSRPSKKPGFFKKIFKRFFSRW